MVQSLKTKTMKPLKSLILIFTAVIAFSCSSSDDDSSGDDIQGGQDDIIIAQVDGSDFESDSFTSASLQSGVLNISGTNSGGDSISFLINNFDAAGTFDLSGSTLEGTAIYLPSGETTFYSSVNQGGEGTIIISEYNENAGTISGTFNFIAVRASDSDTVEVTNGSFSDLTL